jgi:hypothetical protein
MKQMLFSFSQPVRADGHRRPAIDSCVYCGAAANTRDHVPPKTLLEEPRPINLRIVPSCISCNAGWSLDEEYVAVILAQVGHHPHLMAKIEEGGVVDRALSAAPGLDETITKSLVAGDDGRVWFRPSLDRVGRITTKLAFGLFCLKYGRGAAIRDFSTDWISGPEQEIPQRLVAAQWIWPGLQRKRWTTVQKGSFSFLFAKGWMADDPPLYCLLDLHGTIFAAVRCPAPIGRPRDRRLRSKPWA